MTTQILNNQTQSSLKSLVSLQNLFSRILFVASTCLVLVGSGCSEDRNPISPTVDSEPAGEVIGLTVAPTQMSLETGATGDFAVALQVDGSVSNRTIQWTSSRPTVATVNSSGQVTAHLAGTTAIFATSVANQSIRTRVLVAVTLPDVVDEPDEPTPTIVNVSLDRDWDRIELGESTQLTANVESIGDIDQSVAWTTSDWNMARVDENGLVTANGDGIVTITATSVADPSKTADATISIVVPELPETVLKGEFRIRVKANNSYWHVDGNGDRLLSTRYQPNDDFTHFNFEPQNDGTYRISLKATGRYLHEDGNGDKLMSTRYQPNDDFTRFILVPDADGSYRISVKATGRFIHEDGNSSKLISTRWQPNDDHTRFYLEPVLSGSFQIRVESNGRFLHVDGGGDKLLSTRYQPMDNFTRFNFVRQSNGAYRIQVKATGRYLHEDGNGDKLMSTRYQPNDSFTHFFLVPQLNGSYMIQVEANGRMLHEDGGGDRLVSTRYQPFDGFTRFFLTNG